MKTAIGIAAVILLYAAPVLANDPQPPSTNWDAAVRVCHRNAVSASHTLDMRDSVSLPDTVLQGDVWGDDFPGKKLCQSIQSKLQQEYNEMTRARRVEDQKREQAQMKSDYDIIQRGISHPNDKPSNYLPSVDSRFIGKAP